MNRNIVFLTGALLVLSISGCGNGAESDSENSSAQGPSDSQLEEVEIVLAHSVITPTEEVATYAVAQEMGYLEEEGLSASVTTADGSTAALQAVASGSGDVTAASALSLVPAVAKDVPVKAFGGLVQNWPYQIAVPPESSITSPKDLAGKKVGIISLSSASNGYTQSVLDFAGVDPQSAEYIPVGTGASATAALESGEVDALALYGGAYAAMEGQGIELRYLENAPYYEDLFSITWATTPEKLKDDPEKWAGFGRAMYKALLFSATNPEAALEMGYEVFPELQSSSSGIDENDVATLTTWMESATPTEGEPGDWSQWGQITDERWGTFQDFLTQYVGLEEPVDIENLWNGSLVDDFNDFDTQQVIESAKSW